MAIDTALKRQSAAGVAQPFNFLPPFPDGDPTPQADRQHAGLAYTGILVGREVIFIHPTAPAIRTANVHAIDYANILVAKDTRLAAAKADSRTVAV